MKCFVQCFIFTSRRNWSWRKARFPLLSHKHFYSKIYNEKRKEKIISKRWRRKEKQNKKEAKRIHWKDIWKSHWWISIIFLTPFSLEIITTKKKTTNENRWQTGVSSTSRRLSSKRDSILFVLLASSYFFSLMWIFLRVRQYRRKKRIECEWTFRMNQIL